MVGSGAAAAGAGLIAADQAIRLITEDIYNSGKSVFSSLKIRALNKKAFKTIHKKLKSVEDVKTIWRVDEEVNLHNFYYPSKISVSGSNSRITASRIKDISVSKNIIIEGTAGQGKSILLRYLASNEIAAGERIPILIELRKLDRREPILSAINNKLLNLGFMSQEKVVEQFLKSGKVLLLLDGFDEIHSQDRAYVLDEIEALSYRYDDTQIVVTSRPGSGVQNSASFRTVRIAPITSADHKGFLAKICSDQAQANSIATAISKSHISIKVMLTTPLLLTLLTILYKSEQAIPSNLIEFYDKLFYILYTKHDSTKPGFQREIKSGLSEPRFEELFEAFCFLTRQLQKSQLSRREAMENAKRAIATSKIDAEEDAFIDDCCKVACLLIEDGLDYQFIHKSVQEFYAAQFISKRSERVAKSFYELALKDYSSWEQEINFLETKDKYRATKYFLIPAFENMRSGIEEFGLPYITSNTHIMIGGEGEVKGYTNTSAGNLTRYYQQQILDEVITPAINDLFHDDFKFSQHVIDNLVKCSPIMSVGSSDNDTHADLYQALKLAGLEDVLDSIKSRMLQKIRADIDAANSFLNYEDSLDKLIDACS